MKRQYYTKMRRHCQVYKHNFVKIYKTHCEGEVITKMITDINNAGKNALNVLCLGSGPCAPQKNNDTAHYLINGSVLLDTGWATVQGLVDRDIDPLSFDTIVFTHFHPDHYMGLHSLIFYWLWKGRDLSKLRIAGPAENIEIIVRRAAEYWQDDCFRGIYPTLLPLNPGDTVELNGIHFACRRAPHPVPALSYRITAEGAKSDIGFTGDTRHETGQAAFFAGCGILFSEASCGASRNPDPSWGHMSAYQAGQLAAEASVGRLVLVHTGSPEISCAAAREYFANTEPAVVGAVYSV